MKNNNIDNDKNFSDIYIDLLIGLYKKVINNKEIFYILLIISWVYLVIIKLININFFVIFDYLNISTIINYSLLCIFLVFPALGLLNLYFMIIDKLISIKQKLYLIFPKKELGDIIISVIKIFLFIWILIYITIHNNWLLNILYLLGAFIIYYSDKIKTFDKKKKFVELIILIIIIFSLVYFTYKLDKYSNIVIVKTSYQEESFTWKLLYFSWDIYVFDKNNHIISIPKDKINSIEYNKFKFINFFN